MASSAMTPRQRLLAAMRCEVPDRVPIQIRGVHPTKPDWKPLTDGPAGRKRDKSYQVLNDVVLEKCDPVHPVGFEFGWFGIDRRTLDMHTETRKLDEDWTEDVVTIETPEGPLVEVHRRSLKGRPGFQTRHPIADEDDLKRFLSIPAVPPRPDVNVFFDAVKQAHERALEIASIESNPIGMAHDLLGSETLAVWSVTNRDALRSLLVELRSRWETLVRCLLDAGVGPVFATAGHEQAVPPLLAPQDFHELVVEMDKPVMRMIRERGNVIHVHCHYNVGRILDGFIELGINCLHPVESPPMGDIELAEAKRRLKGKICIEGNIQIDVIQRGTPREVREVTRKIIEDAAEGGGLILCPTASPYWPKLSNRIRDNYLAFIDAGIEFGRY
jgi:hypothetical protein